MTPGGKSLVYVSLQDAYSGPLPNIQLASPSTDYPTVKLPGFVTGYFVPASKFRQLDIELSKIS